MRALEYQHYITTCVDSLHIRQPGCTGTVVMTVNVISVQVVCFTPADDNGSDVSLCCASAVQHDELACQPACMV